MQGVKSSRKVIILKPQNLKTLTYPINIPLRIAYLCAY